jgi:hypothetical protein
MLTIWGYRAPIMKWGVVIAGASDFFRPAEKLSITQNLALMATGSIWTRWCFVIRPKNMLYVLTILFFVVGNHESNIIQQSRCGQFLSLLRGHNTMLENPILQHRERGLYRCSIQQALGRYQGYFEEGREGCQGGRRRGQGIGCLSVDSHFDILTQARAV